MKSILSIILIFQTIILFGNDEVKEKFCIENNFYLVKSKDHNTGSVLLKLDLKEYGKFVYINENPSKYLYNAIGYNSNNGFLYGIDVYSKHLLKIDINDGNAKDLGKIKNLPYNSYVAGDFDDEGNYYVLNTSSYSEIFRINIDTKEAISLKLPKVLHNVYDITYSTKDKSFYGISGKNKIFYQMTIENDSVNIVSKSYNSKFNSEFGSSWIDNNNSIISANLFTKFNNVDGNLNVVESNITIDSHFSDGATCQASPRVKAMIGKEKSDQQMIFEPIVIVAPKLFVTNEDEKSNSIKYSLEKESSHDITIVTSHGNVVIAKGEISSMLKLDTYDPDYYIDENSFEVKIISVEANNSKVQVLKSAYKDFG